MALFAVFTPAGDQTTQAPKKEGHQSTAVVAEALMSPEDTYIGQIFRRQISEAPRMGWFVPEHLFVAPEEHADLVLYSAMGTPSSAKLSAAVTDEERKKMKQQHQVACETDEKDRLTGYSVTPYVKPGRALFTTKRLPGKTLSGILTVPLSRTQIAEVRSILGWTKKHGLQRHRAVGVQADSYFYSFHKLYDPESSVVRLTLLYI